MILVTGAAGMVGSAVCRELNRRNVPFVGTWKAEHDLRNGKEVEDMFEKHKPECLVHCAAVVGGVLLNKTQPHVLYHDNVLINTNVIHQANRRGVKKVIAFSSACAFPDTGGLFKEDELQQGQPYHGNLGYGYAKRMVDVQATICNEVYKTRNVTLIPTSIYGPHDNFSLENGHFVSSLIRKTYEAKKNKQPLVLWGTGVALRELLFADDLAKIVVELLSKDVVGKLIVPGEEASVLTVAQAIVELMDLKTGIELDRTKPDGQLRKATDHARFKEVMGDFRFTPYKEGLKQTIKWFLEWKENYLPIRD